MSAHLDSFIYKSLMANLSQQIYVFIPINLIVISVTF